MLYRKASHSLRNDVLLIYIIIVNLLFRSYRGVFDLSQVWWRQIRYGSW
jgi:hypothetical protein